MRKLFISDIRPLLDFASPIWNLGYVGDTKLLESVQRRWTSQVMGLENLDYSARLRELELFSIKGRLLRSNLIMCYKIFHDLSAIEHSELFTMAPNVGTRGHCCKIQVQYTSIDARLKSFTCRVVEDWNSLPSEIVKAPSLDTFKGRLQCYLGDRLYEFIQ